MRILYAAIDQTVPGTIGGSVHVTAVAEGLAALGHEVHVLVPRDGAVSGRRRSTGSRCRRRSGARSCAGRDARAVARIARALAARRGHRALLQLRRRRHRRGAARRRARRAGSQCAGDRLPRLDARRCSIARCSSSRCADGASGSARSRSDRDAERRDPAAGHAAGEDPRARVGRRHRCASSPGAAGALPFARPPAWSRSLPARFAAGTARSTSLAAIRELRRAADTTSRRVFIGDGPELPRVETEAAGLDGVHLHRRAAARRRCRRAWPLPTSASRRSTSRRTAAVARLLLVAAEDLRVHGVRPAGRRAGRRSHPRARRHEREGLLYDPAIAGRAGRTRSKR